MTTDTTVVTASSNNRVVVTDIEMPFWSMVIFMTKWALATIPVALVLLFLGMVLISAVMGTSLPR
jgi:hypothetical protein